MSNTQPLCVFFVTLFISTPASAYLGPGLGFVASTIILIVFLCLILSLYFLLFQPLVMKIKRLLSDDRN